MILNVVSDFSVLYVFVCVDYFLLLILMEFKIIKLRWINEENFIFVYY